MKKGLKTGRLFEPKTYNYNRLEARERGSAKYWIGINSKSGPWAYTSSGLNLEFQHWGPGQSNNMIKNNKCVIIGQWGMGNGLWYHDPCNRKHSFICEFV